MRRYTVHGEGESGRDVSVARVARDFVEVVVGGDRVRIESLRTPSGLLLRLPSGRVVRPHVSDCPGGDPVVTWPGRSFRVARNRDENGRGAAGLPGSRQRCVRTQMPGRVVKVLVRPGDRVAVGQGLVILEAMKMENEVKARRDGVIAAVHVAEGDRVESGADLVEFE